MLSVTCVDAQAQDVTDGVVDFSAIELAADVTLTEGEDLTCTFLNERATFEADDDSDKGDGIYLPLVIK